MKKIIFVIMLLIPLNVFAYTGPLDDEFFTINNQTTSPFNISISGNSSTDVTFKLDYFYNHNISNYDIPGSYLFVSIESNKKLSINRKYNFGSNCSTSCFSNDDYLMLNSDSNGYSYVYYFNIVKWARTVGTQIDQFSVADVFTFHNLESGTATVYIYGSYANNTNEIPNLIQNVETKQQIILGNESIETALNQNTQQILDELQNCRPSVNLVNIDDFIGRGLSKTGNNYVLDGSVDRFSVRVNTFNLEPGTYKLSYNIISGNKNDLRGVFYCGNTAFYLSSNDTITTNCALTSIQFYVPNTSTSVIFNNLQFQKGDVATSYEKYGEQICNSKIDDTNDKLDDVNDSVNDLNDTIIDDSIDSPNSDFSDMEDMIANNGVITNLIALPITLYTSILNGLNQSCSEYNFGQLFGSDLKFQCINLGALLGNTIWGVIDVLFSGFTIYAIAKKMIKVFNNFSGLNEGDVIDD